MMNITCYHSELIDTFSDEEIESMMNAFSKILKYYERQRYKTEMIIPLNVAMNHIVKSSSNDFAHISVFVDSHGVSMIRLLSIFDIENGKTTLCTNGGVYDAVINYSKYAALINKCMGWKYLKLNRLDEVRRVYLDMTFRISRWIDHEYEICVFRHDKKYFVIDEMTDYQMKENALLTAIMDTMEQLDMDIPDPVCQYSTIEDLMAYLKQLKETAGMKNYDPHVVELDEDYNKIFYGLGNNNRLYYSKRRMEYDNLVYKNYDNDGYNSLAYTYSDEECFEDCFCERCDNYAGDCECKLRIEEPDHCDYDSPEYKLWERRLTRPTIYLDEIADGKDENVKEVALEKSEPINAESFLFKYNFALKDARKAFFMVLKYSSTLYDFYTDGYHSNNRFDSIDPSDRTFVEEKGNEMKIDCFTVTPDRKIQYEYRKRFSKKPIDSDDLDYHLHKKEYIHIVTHVMGWVKFHRDRMDEVKAKYYEISRFPVHIIPSPRKVSKVNIDICNDETLDNYTASIEKNEYMWRAIIDYEEKLRLVNKGDYNERKKIEEELKEQNRYLGCCYVFTNDERNRLYKRLVELKKKAGEKVDKEYLEEDDDLILELEETDYCCLNSKISPYSSDIIGAKSWKYEDIQWYEDAERDSNGNVVGSCKKLDEKVQTIV